MSSQLNGTGPDIAVPLYLDEPAMLDLLASIDDGFVTVEKVIARNADRTDREGSVSGDVSSAGWLSGILKIGFTGAAKTSRGQNQENEREGERFHTPGSLLHRLRTLLLQQDLLKRLGDDKGKWADIKPADFVELRGSITPNPFGETIKAMINSLNFLARLESQGGSQVANSRSATGNITQPRRNAQSKENPLARTLETLLSDLERADVKTLVIGPAASTDILNYSVVATISTEYLRVPSIGELSNSEYRILGHVTRHLAEGADSSINLLKGSVIGALAESDVDAIVGPINDQLESAGWRVDRASSTIPPPVLQVFPIAIYT